MRAAIQEKIRADKRRLRERRRRQAMRAYGDDFEAAFESLEGEDFASRVAGWHGRSCFGNTLRSSQSSPPASLCV